jgi:hypothetical protein
MKKEITHSSLWRGDLGEEFQEGFHSTEKFCFAHSSSAKLILAREQIAAFYCHDFCR